MTWHSDYSRPGVEPYWLPNPLALGEFCGTCNTRLEHKPNGGGLYACPFGPHEGEK